MPITRQNVSDDVTAKITSKTVAGSLTNTDDGANRELILDYIDQQIGQKTYKAKISQSGSSISAAVLRNDTGKTFTYTRNSTGSFNLEFSSLYSDLSKIDIYIHLQNGSFTAPQLLIDNLGVLATIESRYWNGSGFVLSDDILNNATIYLIVND